MSISDTNFDLVENIFNNLIEASHKNKKLTTKEIVGRLDEHIIGQTDAKRAIANALMWQWRFMQLKTSNEWDSDTINAELKERIIPKNIIFIGPPGVGKSEIARIIASIIGTDAFIKVDATKYTEVGYVGRDVDSIIRDLVDACYKKIREKAIEQVSDIADKIIEEKLLDALLPKSPKSNEDATQLNEPEGRNVIRKLLQSGKLDSSVIDIEILQQQVGIEIMGPPGMEELTSQLQNMLHSVGPDKAKLKKMKVSDARKALRNDVVIGLIDETALKRRAVENVEQQGIVFIDEIDKTARSRKKSEGGVDVSGEGVQRDLLPMVEGCTVSTKYGFVKTDHILFIASGAFTLTKPSDLIPELQGRFPIRVELKALTASDFERILIEPKTSLIKQYTALMLVENLHLIFKEDAIKEIANMAWKINEKIENIGARRLYTLMERVLEKISFDSAEYNATKDNPVEIIIDKKYVDKQLSEIIKDENLEDSIL